LCVKRPVAEAKGFHPVKEGHQDSGSSEAAARVREDSVDRLVLRPYWAEGVE
jgi:hypothetical protein